MQGKSIDIDAIRLSNENAIAVGNMRVNARGDQLGPGGKVTQTRNQTMDQHYKIHTPMASTQQIHEAQIRNKSQGVINKQGQAAPIPQVDPDGLPFDEPLDATPVIEKAPLRGNLADSIAKSVDLKQELMSTNKPKGPQRI